MIDEVCLYMQQKRKTRGHFPSGVEGLGAGTVFQVVRGDVHIPLKIINVYRYQNSNF